MGNKPRFGCGAEIVKAAAIGNRERRAIPHFALDELLRGKSPEEWRAEYAGAFDWDPMSGVRSSRNDAFGLRTRRCRFGLERFRPGQRSEQAGRRRARVVSPVMFTENTGLTIVCPITSRPFPTSVVLPAGLRVPDEPYQPIDTRAAPIWYPGASLPVGVARLVRAKLDAIAI
jgi:hypothetical protein